MTIPIVKTTSRRQRTKTMTIPIVKTTSRRQRTKTMTIPIVVLSLFLLYMIYLQMSQATVLNFLKEINVYTKK
jgi:hypothetical protein